MNWKDEDRPSRLALDRFAAGELKGPERAAVQQYLSKHPDAMAHLEDLKQARGQVPGLNIAALRERAGVPEPAKSALVVHPDDEATITEGTLDETTEEVLHSVDDDLEEIDLDTTGADLPAAKVEFIGTGRSSPPRRSEPPPPVRAATPGGTPRRTTPAAPVRSTAPPSNWRSEGKAKPPPVPENRPWLLWLLMGSMAAVVFVTVMMQPPATTRFKGEPTLQVFSLENDVLTPYEGARLGAGDVIGFQVSSSANSVVIYSVDGNGNFTLFYPEKGDSQPLVGGVGEALPGTVTLDSAMGPEIFVAFFNVSVTEARRALDVLHEKGGNQAIIDYADKVPEVAQVQVQRK